MPRLIFSDRQILVLPLKKLLKIVLAKDKSYGKPVNSDHVIGLPVELSLRCLGFHLDKSRATSPLLTPRLLPHSPHEPTKLRKPKKLNTYPLPKNDKLKTEPHSILL